MHKNSNRGNLIHMCKTCDACKGLSTAEAFKVLAVALKSKERRKCVDDLIGQLAGVVEPERNLHLDAAWERERQ